MGEKLAFALRLDPQPKGILKSANLSGDTQNTIQRCFAKGFSFETTYVCKGHLPDRTQHGPQHQPLAISELNKIHQSTNFKAHKLSNVR